MTIRLSPIANNAVLSHFATLCNTGFIEFYTGAPPTNVPDSLSAGQVLVAEIRLQGFASYNTANNSIAALLTIPENACLVTGTITWARLLNNSREILMDMPVSTDTNVNGIHLSVVEVSVGTPLEISAFNLRLT